MAKSARKKGSSKRQIANGSNHNTVNVVVSGGGGLIPGQKVILYKPTDRKIVDSSGKIIGKKEHVIGIGKVFLENDTIVVKSPNFHYVVTPSVKTVGPSFLRRHGLTNNKNNIIRSSSLHQKSKSQMEMILVKPIDE